MRQEEMMPRDAPSPQENELRKDNMEREILKEEMTRLMALLQNWEDSTFKTFLINKGSTKSEEKQRQEKLCQGYGKTILGQPYTPI